MIDLTSVKAIIFDLGGVVIDVDMEKPYNDFAEMVKDDDPELVKEDLLSTAFDLEVGLSDPKEFYREVRAITKKKMKNEEIDEIWNSMLGEVDPENIVLLDKLKAKYKILALSNTNEIHEAEFNKRFAAVANGRTPEQIFDKAFYSHDMGMRKPDEYMYKEVLESYDLEPEDALFIDDNADNVKAAQAMGIKGYHLKKGEKIVDLLKDA